jgi:hypothetical protein
VPVHVVIQADDVGGRLAIVARVGDAPPRDPVDIEVADGKPAEPGRVARLPQGAQVALREVGTGSLKLDSRGLRFTWPGVDIAPGCLLAGARLLAAIAVDDRAGVYR